MEGPSWLLNLHISKCYGYQENFDIVGTGGEGEQQREDIVYALGVFSCNVLNGKGRLGFTGSVSMMTFLGDIFWLQDVVVRKGVWGLNCSWVWENQFSYGGSHGVKIIQQNPKAVKWLVLARSATSWLCRLDKSDQISTFSSPHLRIVSSISTWLARLTPRRLQLSFLYLSIQPLQNCETTFRFTIHTYGKQQEFIVTYI